MLITMLEDFVAFESYSPVNHYVSHDGMGVTGYYNQAHGQFVMNPAITRNLTFNLTISGMGIVKVNTFGGFHEVVNWIQSKQPMPNPCTRIRGTQDTVCAYGARIRGGVLEFLPFAPGQTNPFSLSTRLPSTVLAFDIECGDIQISITNIRDGGRPIRESPMHVRKINEVKLHTGYQLSLPAPTAQSLVKVVGNALTPETVLLLHVEGPASLSHTGSYFRIWVLRENKGQGQSYIRSSSCVFPVAPRELQTYILAVKTNQLNITNGTDSRIKHTIKEDFDKYTDITLWVEFYRLTLVVSKTDLVWDLSSDHCETQTPPRSGQPRRQGMQMPLFEERNDNWMTPRSCPSPNLLDFTPPMNTRLLSSSPHDNTRPNELVQISPPDDINPGPLMVPIFQPEGRSTGTLMPFFPIENTTSDRHSPRRSPGNIQLPTPTPSHQNISDHNTNFSPLEHIRDLDPICRGVGSLDLLQNGGNGDAPVLTNATQNDWNNNAAVRKCTTMHTQAFYESAGGTRDSQDGSSYLSILSNSENFPSEEQKSQGLDANNCNWSLPKSAPIPCPYPKHKGKNKKIHQSNTMKNMKKKLTGCMPPFVKDSGSLYQADTTEFFNQGYFQNDDDPDNQFLFSRCSNNNNTESPAEPLCLGTTVFHPHNEVNNLSGSSNTSPFSTFKPESEQHRMGSSGNHSIDLYGDFSSSDTLVPLEAQEAHSITRNTNMTLSNSGVPFNRQEINDRGFQNAPVDKPFQWLQPFNGRSIISNNPGSDSSDSNSIRNNMINNNNNNNNDINNKQDPNGGRDEIYDNKDTSDVSQGDCNRSQRESKTSSELDSGYNDAGSIIGRRMRLSAYNPDDSHHQTFPKRLM